MRNFQKCLIRFAEAKGKQAVFLENHLAALRHKAALSVECVFLDARDAQVAPGYFKKAILEAEGEWSQHRKLYDTRGSIRGTVPPGFAYLQVGFGPQAGYAKVVEDEESWQGDFGRGVLEGLLEHPDTGIPLHRRKRDDFEEGQGAHPRLRPVVRPLRLDQVALSRGIDARKWNPEASHGAVCVWRSARHLRRVGRRCLHAASSHMPSA